MPVQLAYDQLNISSGGSGPTTTGGSAYLTPNGVNGFVSDAFGFSSWQLGSSGITGGATTFSYTYQDFISVSPANGESFVYDIYNWYGQGNGALLIGGVIVQNYFSDSKYKDNVSPISNALDKVNSLRGVEFDWNALANEEQGRTGHDVGVIAQEVQAVYPIAVREVDKEREDHVVSALVVDYEKLIPLLLQSIKELSAEVNSLKQQINGTNI